MFEGYEVHDLRVDYSGSASATRRGLAARRRRARQARRRLRLPRGPTSLEADVEALNLAVIDPDLPETALRVRLEARGDEKAANGTIARR